MERRAWFKRIGMAALGFGGIALLGAFRHGPGGGHGDPAHMERMLGAHLDDVLDDVEATPEQREKIQAVKARLVEKRKATRGERREMMRELLAQWESDKPDVARVHARIDERAREMQAFAHEAADAIAEVHGILTPEQRAKLAKRWHRRLDR